MSTPIHDIPKEIYFKILGLLDLSHITVLARTSEKLHKLSREYLRPFYGEIPEFFDALMNTVPEDMHPGQKRIIAKIQETFPEQMPGPQSLYTYLDAIKDAAISALSTFALKGFHEFAQFDEPKLFNGVFDQVNYIAKAVRSMDTLYVEVGYFIDVEQMVHAATACAIAATYQFDKAIGRVDQLEDRSLKASIFGPFSLKDVAFEKIVRIVGKAGDVSRVIEITNKMTDQFINSNCPEILSDLLRANDIDGAIKLVRETPWNERYAQILSNHSHRYAEMGKMEEAHQLADEINDEEMKRVTLVLIEEFQS